MKKEGRIIGIGHPMRSVEEEVRRLNEEFQRHKISWWAEAGSGNTVLILEQHDTQEGQENE